MKSFIEELYYGNIDPQNSGLEDDAGVQRELRTISDNEDWLTGHLAGEEKNLTFLIGQSMRALKGKADHQVVRQTLIDLLNGMK